MLCDVFVPQGAAPKPLWENEAPRPKLLLAAATADDDVLLRQLTHALGNQRRRKRSPRRLSTTASKYLRAKRGLTPAAGDANKVREAFSRRITPAVPVIDLQATFENCSALCAFLDVGVPENVEAYVLLSLGSGLRQPLPPGHIKNFGEDGREDRPRLRSFTADPEAAEVVRGAALSASGHRAGGVGRGRYGNDAVGDAIACHACCTRRSTTCRWVYQALSLISSGRRPG